MCRLYGLSASHPTQPACDLLEAQNALIAQSREDERGLSNPHGWGMGLVSNDGVQCFRQVQPASKSEDFRAQALKAEGTRALAHVRRATIGTPSIENTHPFRDSEALLIHNGHIAAFDAVQPRLLDALPDARRAAIQGTTDSEHFFQLARSQWLNSAVGTQVEAVRSAIRAVEDWSAAVDPDAEVALNVLWSEADGLAGSRLNRSRWVLERTAPYQCAICGTAHARPPSGADYRSVVVASERITDEDWIEVPNRSVLFIDEALQLHIEPLDK